MFFGNSKNSACVTYLGEVEIAFTFFNRITALNAYKNLQNLFWKMCDLDIASKFELQCTFQVSVSSHLQDVLLFIAEISLCLL